MHTYFWWYLPIKNFLFYNYNINSSAGVIVTCFGLVALSFFFEWLKLMQARFRQKELLFRSKQLRSLCPSESSTLLGQNNVAELTSLKNRALLHIHELVLWSGLQNVGYLLMLIVMFYNGWFVISTLIGSTLGYFIFGQTFIKINIRNCQILRDTYCMLKCEESGSSNSTEQDQAGESTPALERMSCHAVPETVVTVHTVES